MSHVFVSPGDVTHLASDAWLLPTDRALSIRQHWHDDHFHELMHDVRDVLPPSQRGEQKLGTAIMLSSSALRDRMWGSDLTLIGVGGDDIPHQARRLEIFLDCLLAHADQGLPHFLDARYQQRLDPAERRLADRLRELSSAITGEERTTAAWPRVRQLLDDLGGASEA